MFKFESVIGNPPYNIEHIHGSTRNIPVYNLFIDKAMEVCGKCLLIVPARFLFNAGQTKKEWNRRMLENPHIKVVYYNVNSYDVFPDVNIVSGIAVIYCDFGDTHEPINLFIPYPELKSIVERVSTFVKAQSSNFGDTQFLDSVACSQNNYDLKALYEDHPEYREFISDGGRHSQLKSNALERVPIFVGEDEVFKIGDREASDFVKIHGLVNKKRTVRFCQWKYIREHPALDKWKVLVAKAGGSGVFGDVLSEMIVAGPSEGCTQTFMMIGMFETKQEAENLRKYLKTKFARAMLGVLKVTQDNAPEKWKFVPMQEFGEGKEIDWRMSVKEIDWQLYEKYGLSKEEVCFIETNVKEML